MQRRGIRYSEPPVSWSDSASRCARRATSSPGASAPCSTPSSCWPPRWSRPASGRCCGWPTGSAGGWGARVPRLRARSAAPSAATTDAAPWSTWSTSASSAWSTTPPRGDGEPGADLHRPAYTGWLTGELDRILGVTDVHRARKDGIFPLPARARDEDGVLQVVEYRPAHSPPRGHRAHRPGAEQPARAAAAGAAVEERAARPQPAQPADQLHRALGPRADRARLRARHPRELRPRRDADHPAAGRPAGRGAEGARGHHGPRAARGAADRAAGRAPRGARRRHRRRLPAAAAQPRLQGEDGARGDRRQQPLPRPRQPGVGARRAAAALPAGAHPRRPRRWAAPAPTGWRSTRPGRARRTTACWRSCARCTGSPSRR